MREQAIERAIAKFNKAEFIRNTFTVAIEAGMALSYNREMSREIAETLRNKGWEYKTVVDKSKKNPTKMWKLMVRCKHENDCNDCRGTEKRSDNSPE